MYINQKIKEFCEENHLQGMRIKLKWFVLDLIRISNQEYVPAKRYNVLYDSKQRLIDKNEELRLENVKLKRSIKQLGL